MEDYKRKSPTSDIPTYMAENKLITDFWGQRKINDFDSQRKINQSKYIFWYHFTISLFFFVFYYIILKKLEFFLYHFTTSIHVNVFIFYYTHYFLAYLLSIFLCD